MFNPCLGAFIFLFGVFPIFFVVINVLAMAVAGHRRRNLLQHRNPLSDRQFLDHIAALPTDANCISAVRKVLGQMCKVPSDMIYPTDTPDVLSCLMQSWLLDGFDFMIFSIWLGEELGADLNKALIDRFPKVVFGPWQLKGDRAASIGQWAADVAAYLREQSVV